MVFKYRLISGLPQPFIQSSLSLSFSFSLLCFIFIFALTTKQSLSVICVTYVPIADPWNGSSSTQSTFFPDLFPVPRRPGMWSVLVEFDKWLNYHKATCISIRLKDYEDQTEYVCKHMTYSQTLALLTHNNDKLSSELFFSVLWMGHLPDFQFWNKYLPYWQAWGMWWKQHAQKTVNSRFGGWGSEKELYI